MKNKVSASVKKRLLSMKRPNIIINIGNLKCVVDADPCEYSEADVEKMQRIVDAMSRDIWIDRTYVAFNGNRWKDAFINEDMWYKFTRAVVKTDCGTKGGGKTLEFVEGGMLIIALTYLYDILMKYGYSPEGVEIRVKKRSTYKTSYVEDTRNDWRF